MNNNKKNNKQQILQNNLTIKQIIKTKTIENIKNHNSNTNNK